MVIRDSVPLINGRMPERFHILWEGWFFGSHSDCWRHGPSAGPPGRHLPCLRHREGDSLDSFVPNIPK